eukprot:8015099-Lingulodinium_polyedra.AAC.1
MQARSCNPVPDFVQPADGAPEYNVAPTHGGIAVLVEWMTTARPAVHRPVVKPMLADGAESTVPGID